MRLFSEQPARSRRHALELAPEGDEVEVGFEDAGLAPALLDVPGGLDLPPLLGDRAASAGPLQALVQHGRKLHGDSAGPPGSAGENAPDRGRGERSKIRAAVRPEALVLSPDHSRLQRRRNSVQLDPTEPPQALIGPELVQHRAVAVEQQRIRHAKARPHVLVGRLSQGCANDQQGGYKRAADNTGTFYVDVYCP